MSCLSWNCHGLGNAATFKKLRDLAKKFAPSVLCVLETQVHKARVESLKESLREMESSLRGILFGESQTLSSRRRALRRE
jgi:exonuclease III